MLKKHKETPSPIFFTLLAIMFGWKYEIDSLKYRKEIYRYLRWTNNTKNLIYITNIRVFKQKDKTIIQIVTHRPGILIGKAGNLLDGLISHLTHELEEGIKIDLVECTLWYNLNNSY